MRLLLIFCGTISAIGVFLLATASGDTTFFAAQYPLLVALTGWGQEDDRRKSVEAGFNGHLVKPVDYDNLLKLLNTLTNGADGSVLS